MKLYLVRHGQSIANKNRICQGFSDSQLSEDGLNQAQKIGERLKNEKFDTVFSSDLVRVKQTGEGILKHHNNEVIFDERLRETFCGDWEGRYWDEIEDSFYKYDFPLKRLSNGETFDEHIKRVSEFIKENFEVLNGKNVLLVSHGGTIKAILKSLDLISYENLAEDPSMNTSLYIINIDKEGKANIELTNCIRHLEDE
jgi:broad specificity phosphatase PhoE